LVVYEEIKKKYEREKAEKGNNGDQDFSGSIYHKRNNTEIFEQDRKNVKIFL